MVGTLGIALALWLATPSNADPTVAATHRSEAPFAQDPAPQQPQPQQPQPQEPRPQEPAATVDAHVKLRDGKPAEGARIVGKGPTGTKVEAFADAGGRFQITGPKGAYALDIQAGDQRGRFTANIRDGKLTPAEFILK